MHALLPRFAPPLAFAALAALLALGLALRVQTGRLDKARTALALETALHATDIATFKAAQARAQADWQAELARLTAINRRRKDEADRQADHTLALYRNRVLRLPPATARAGDAGAPRLSAAGPAASLDRSGEDAILLARTDALICAENSARLQAAHAWARTFAPRAAATDDILTSH